MDEMTRAERACANVVIAQVIKDWTALQDGDLVSMVAKINGLVAMSIEAQRNNRQKQPA